MIDWLSIWVGGGCRYGLVFWIRAENRLVLCQHRNWLDFLYGWSILTWSQCGGRTWLDFSLGIGIIFFGPGGRKRLGFSIWIGIDLSFVWWCSTANRYRVLTDRYAGYVLEICWLCSRRPPSHRWLSRSALILCKRTKEVRASNFSQGWLSSSVVYPA